ncbi:hypothetical protein AK812_SmicGene21164 [Symbiodinium microadriaticum]|uniref:Uncharacterized protein n=1 Tax=Symbiodinium microadriaticum TaxID=2951 RepID=A0A1Q9DN82_SYMMI|nr:hypothetical protein AK812_SmicGene21164 [Symbiodinium microadriaticum]
MTPSVTSLREEMDLDDQDRTKGKGGKGKWQEERSGEQGMVSILCQAADKWRSLKEAMGWLDNEGNWRVLKWNAVQQHLEVDATVK